MIEIKSNELKKRYFLTYPNPIHGPWMLSAHVIECDEKPLLYNKIRPHILVMLWQVNPDQTLKSVYSREYMNFDTPLDQNVYMDLKLWAEDTGVILPSGDQCSCLCEKVLTAALEEHIYRMCTYAMSSGLSSEKCLEAVSMALCNKVLSS